MSKLFKVLPFAYVLFKFYLKTINTGAQKLLVFLVLILYISLNYLVVFKKTDRYRFNSCVLMWVTIAAIALLVPVVHGTGDFSYARKLLTNTNELLSWTAFIIFVKKEAENGNELEVLTDRFGMIVSMYVFFSVICMFAHGFRAFWKTVVFFSEKELFELQYEKYIGRFGWDGFAGFNATFLCSFGVLLCLACLNRKLHARESTIKFGVILSYMVVFLIGNVLYGRTGLIVSSLMILLLLIQVCIVNKKIQYLFLALLLGLFAIVAIVILKDAIPALSALYEWAFEPIINYLSGKGFSATSLDSLKRMYVMPTSSTVLFGDGYYTDPVTGSYYRNTDVGVLRLTYMWGIIPTILAYLFTLKVFQRTIINDGMMRYLVFIMLVLFEAKGEVFRMLLYMFTAISLLGVGEKTGRYLGITFRRLR